MVKAEALAEFQGEMRQKVLAGEVTPEEAEQRERAWRAAKEENSHESFFSKKPLKDMTVVALGDGSDDEDIAKARQQGRRVKVLEKVVADALVNRVVEPTGPQIMNVNFKEYTQICQDPKFTPFGRYVNGLLYYSGPDGSPDTSKPRSRPLRPLMEGEVGMFTTADGTLKIVCFKNQGPDDYGGKYHQVRETLKGED